MSKTKPIDSYFKKINQDNPGCSSSIPNTEQNQTPIPNTEQNQTPIPEHDQRPIAEKRKRDDIPSSIPRVETPIGDNSYALERDPALRKQIYEYPEYDRSKVRLEYIGLKPFQPIRDQYPLSGPQKHRRSFLSSWYDQFPWLEYSPSKDATYCFPCFLFCNKKKGCFTYSGFRNWRKVNAGKYCSFLVHMGKGANSEHNKAYTSYLNLMNPEQRIAAMILRQSAEEIQKNRLRLRTSIDVVRWLTFQNCAFRGHDESENSQNRGNFIELIKFVASYNANVDKVVLQNAPGNASYTSSTIQKEILEIMARKVQARIRKEIGEAKFCVILDESRDQALREQMAIVLRFVDKNGILRERFLDLVHVQNTTARNLLQDLYKVLTFHDLSAKNIRGQGYDGASNMRGDLNGLKALILQDSPFAYYVHCFAHRLQLSLVGAAREVIPIQQFFTRLSIIIVNLVDASSKRHDELQAAQTSEIANRIANDDGIETGRGLNQVGNLQRAGDTRWTSHLKSVTSLLRMFNATGTVLKTIISEGNSTQRADADAAYDSLMSFEFVFILHLMRKLLGISDNLCQALQRRSQDIVNAMSLVSTTKTLIQNFREAGWEDLLEETKTFCDKNDVLIPDMSARYTAAATDSQLQEINNRFNENVIDLLLLSASLDPSGSFKSFDISKICELVNKYYPEDFSQQEKCQLPYELQVFLLEVSKHPELQKSFTLSHLCQGLAESGKANVCPLVYRLICLVLTLPVSTATCERAFSAMKIVKNELLGQDGG